MAPQIPAQIMHVTLALCHKRVWVFTRRGCSHTVICQKSLIGFMVGVRARYTRMKNVCIGQVTQIVIEL